jgi:hypothetical protein
VDTRVGDNNSDGVFDGDDHNAAADDDFDYQELLYHIEPHVLRSMGTQRGLSNMNILEKSSKDLLYDELSGCGKKFTQLRVMLELLKLKASHGWSDNSFLELESSSKITFKAEHIAHKHLQSKEAYMFIVLRCGQNTRMFEPLYFVP